MRKLSSKERSALPRLRQIVCAKKPELLRATWIKMKHPCGRLYCRCAKTKRFWHISWYVSQSNKGKPRMKSVPKDQLQEVRNWIDRYQEARSLLNRIGDLYWERIGSKQKV